MIGSQREQPVDDFLGGDLFDVRAVHDPETPDQWLRNVPLAPTLDDLLIEYPAADTDGNTYVASTRIPLHWIEMLDVARQRPSAKIPNGLFEKRSTFFRWCIARGMADYIRILKTIEDEDSITDPLINARLFLEQHAGRVATRSQLMNDTIAKAEELGKAVTHLVRIEETTEAANMINDWIGGAHKMRETGPFWESFFCRTLLDNEEVRNVVRALLHEGMIDDEFFLAMCEASHLFDDLPEEPAGAVDSH